MQGGSPSPPLTRAHTYSFLSPYVTKLLSNLSKMFLYGKNDFQKSNALSKQARASKNTFSAPRLGSGSFYFLFFYLCTGSICCGLNFVNCGLATYQSCPRTNKAQNIVPWAAQ